MDFQEEVGGDAIDPDQLMACVPMTYQREGIERDSAKRAEYKTWGVKQNGIGVADNISYTL